MGFFQAVSRENLNLLWKAAELTNQHLASLPGANWQCPFPTKHTTSQLSDVLISRFRHNLQVILRINQHSFNYLWKNSEENGRATNTHNCKARGIPLWFGNADIAVRARCRGMTDSQSHQIEVMRWSASPRWRPNPEITWHHDRYPLNIFD